MRGQAGFFGIDERLKEISAKGDDLERLSAIVDFEAFRPDLARAVPRSDGSKGGRPPFDHVFMWKVLILQASHSLSDERTEFLIKDRLSFMRFLGLGLSDPVPDANTIWTFREALTRATIGGAPAITVLFRAYEAALTKAGFLAMGGACQGSSDAQHRWKAGGGQRRDATLSAARPAYKISLHLRGDLPTGRKGCRPHPAVVQHRYDEPAPRRDFAQRCRWRPRRAADGPGWLAPHAQASAPRPYLHCRAPLEMPRAQPSGEHLAVHAR
jgi:hypothetical protein